MHATREGSALGRRTCLLIASLCLLSGLAGCSSHGQDFERPDPATLVLGQTTLADAIARFGQPTSRNVRRSLNPAPVQLGAGTAYAVTTGARVAGTIDSLTYRYSTHSAPGVVVGPWTSRSKSLSLAFWDERLVYYSFTSTFSRDSPVHDENKLRGFVRGQTTRAEVIQALGPPTGEAIYPFVEKDGTRLLIYEQMTTDSSGATPLSTETVTRLKSFRLLFDAADRLIDSTQHTAFASY